MGGLLALASIWFLAGWLGAILILAGYIVLVAVGIVYGVYRLLRWALA